MHSVRFALPARLTAGVLACVAVLAVYTWQSSVNRTTHGFVAYYAAARLFASGQHGPAVYDDRWFGRYIQELTQSDVLEIYGPNTPALPLLTLPIAVFDHGTARAVWLFVSILVFAAAWLTLAASSTRPVPLWLVAVVFLSPAVFANLRTGQAYLVVCAAYCSAAFALHRGRDTAAGALIGAVFAIKSAGAPLLLLLAWQRRWRAVAGAAVAICVAVLLIVPWTDVGIWKAYPSYVREFVGRPGTSATAYQTAVGFMKRLCVQDQAWNPQAPLSCEGAARWLPWAVTAGAVAITLIAVRGPRSELWVAAGVSLSVLDVPIAAEQHFVSLAVPLVALWHQRAATWWMWLTIALLLMVPADLSIHRFQDGWQMLLAYPRLYAAWLVWGLIIGRLLALGGCEPQRPEAVSASVPAVPAFTPGKASGPARRGSRWD